MPEKTYLISHGDFTGGEASIFPSVKMPKKFSTKIQNLFITEQGGIAPIPGYSKINNATVTAALKNGFDFLQSDGTRETLVAGGGDIYKVAGAVLTSIKAGLDAGAKVFFEQMNDLAIMLNGVDAPMKYDGTTVSALGGTPPATAFKALVHKNRVWMIERTDKMVATYSALNSPEDYAGAGSGFIDFKFVLGQGDELMDMATFVDLIVFFFRNHIVIYSGSDPTGAGDFAIVQVIKRTGVVATGTIQDTGTDLTFISATGIKSLRQVVTTGSMNLRDVSERIDPVLLPLIATADNFSVAHYEKYSWVLFLVGNIVWVYSYIFKAWTRIVGADIEGMFTTTDGTLYLCGTGFLYQYDDGNTFAGVNPARVWEHPWLRFFNNGLKGYPKIIKIDSQPIEPVDIVMSYRFDNKDVESNCIETVTLNAVEVTQIDDVLDFDALDPFDESSSVETRVPMFGRGEIMQLIIKNTSDKDFEINNMNIITVQGGL